MPRDEQSLKIEPWAEDVSGNRIDPEDSTPALVRGDGWGLTFSQAGGDTPSREVFNQILREITGMLHEINTHGGALEWSNRVFYTHPALVFGSDNQLYISVRSTPADSGFDLSTLSDTIDTAADPTMDTDDSDWSLITADYLQNVTGSGTAATRLVNAIDAAVGNSDWQSGGGGGGSNVTEASDTEVRDGGGTSTDYVSARRLGQRTAATNRSGLVELATNSETQAGSDSNRAVTPAGLAARTATTTRTGVVELATNTEASTGADTSKAVTPSGLASRTATETRTGLIELATQTEVNSATDTEKAITPATLEGRLSDFFSGAALGRRLSGQGSQSASIKANGATRIFALVIGGATSQSGTLTWADGTVTTFDNKLDTTTFTTNQIDGNITLSSSFGTGLDTTNRRGGAVLVFR